MYCAGEIKLAKELYPQYIEKLIATPKEKIEIYEDYTLFRKFCMNMSISRKCVNHLEKMLKAEGIEEVMDGNRKYIGVKVLNIEELTKEMNAAAKMLEFEHAAYLRDKINELKGKRNKNSRGH